MHLWWWRMSHTGLLSMRFRNLEPSQLQNAHAALGTDANIELIASSRCEVATVTGDRPS
jgi:hypothetical protein